MDKFQIDYSIQDKLKIAIDLAITYCEDHIQTTDSYSKKQLHANLIDLRDLKDEIGNGFVVGSFD